MEPFLSDPFGRSFPYLRLSLTDVCNFRCSYCLPNGYQKCGGAEPLSVDEILRLVRGFISMGVWKIRLTGGEPTIRPDFIDIAQHVSSVPGIRKLALTTNGYKLPERARDYRLAGIDAINISIDSLNPGQFATITGHDRLGEILEGLNICLQAGFSSVKINTVLLKGLNDGEIDAFLDFVQARPVSLRFIELMQTVDNAGYFSAHHLPGAAVIQALEARGWQPKPREEGAGPAQEFIHPQAQGRIGLIAPYSKDFCKSCNRLRVSSRGELHLCLFGEGGHSLRPLLQRDDQQAELSETIRSLLTRKHETHYLHRGDPGTRRHLASIGG